MRRLATATAPPPTAAVAKVHPWKSPIPYLFGGLALTMLLIAGALIILACSYRKRFFTDPSEDGEKDEPAAMAVDLDLVMEPKVLVIMAGNDMPTFLATPATTAKATGDGRLCCSCSTDQRDDDQNPSP